LPALPPVLLLAAGIRDVLRVLSPGLTKPYSQPVPAAATEQQACDRVINTADICPTHTYTQ